MKFTSLYEKFMVAVDVLATSPASLQKQLEGAYRSFIDIEPEDFDDDEMQATFEQIRSRLTRSPTGTDRCHRCDLQANVRSGGRRSSRFYLQPLSEDCGETSLLLLTTVKSPHADHEANIGSWPLPAPLKCLLVAQSRHRFRRRSCLLSGAKRTSPTPVPTSAYDPKRTFQRSRDGIEPRPREKARFQCPRPSD